MVVAAEGEMDRIEGDLERRRNEPSSTRPEGP
jgi:hypothetical protein